MKYSVITADPPWKFGDKLTMADIKRGAASHYATLSTKELMQLSVEPILADSAVLALWCPSSMLEDGFAVGRSWGFDKYVGTWTWVKRNLLNPKLAQVVKGRLDGLLPPEVLQDLLASGSVAFGMGHVFRGATEHALIFRRGKKLEVQSHRRNVYIGPPLPHSVKPEALQDDLDAMYPEGHRLELFARRFRDSEIQWDCSGLECDGLDVREALVKAAEYR